ncbi:hypothetical protein [Streptomyces sp. NBC_01477]|uniref:hypothetical protein n=1 Tax=Streptomyces sp. NBC_01477 TaxID=2976015 RepID=UPI002E3326D1|nr:hypothetical protein [Streptomyces sp. NBC_01477]
MNRRRYRRRTCCGGKKRHRNQAAAEGAAPLDIYRCRHCGHLHVGHHHKTR